MTWLPISLKNAAKCDKWYQLQNHLITESLNANGARVEAFFMIVNTEHAALSVVQKPKKESKFLFYEDSSLCRNLLFDEEVTVSVLTFVSATNELNGFIGGLIFKFWSFKKKRKDFFKPLQDFLGFSILFVLKILWVMQIRHNQKKTKIIAIFSLFF